MSTIVDKMAASRKQAKLQLSRQPHMLPVMRIDPDARKLFSFIREDFTLEFCHADSAVRAPVTA